MKTRCTFVAFLLVALLVCVTAGATVTATAATPTRCTLSTSASSATVGQTITLSGTLAYQTRTHPPISGAPVELYEQTGTTWTPIQGTVTTSGSPNFAFSVTLQEAGTHTYRVVFDGLQLAGPCASNQVAINVLSTLGTSLTLHANPDHADVGQDFNLFGSLKDAYAMGVGNQPVELYYQYPGATTWTYWTTLNTNSVGYYSQTAHDHTTVVYKAVFAGDATYSSASSLPVTVEVKRSTAISLYSSGHEACTDNWLYGWLKTKDGLVLTNQPVEVYYRYVGGADWTQVTWTYWKTLTTDDSGQFQTQTSASKDISYRVVWAGTDKYFSCSNTTTVKITFPTELSLEYTTYYQQYTWGATVHFTFSGWLRDCKGNGVPNAKVWLYEGSPKYGLYDGHYESGVVYHQVRFVKTHSDGSYTAFAKEDNGGLNHIFFFKIVFEGNERYEASESNNVRYDMP